ncbi:MAG: hypothetical protein HY010_17050 [Acidobacteria bacterium]|nr:hypothetical protein [Acidobacteriota bacterium]
MCSRSQAAVAQVSQLSVFVYDDAHVPEATLERGEEVAGRIYQRAGIAIQWNDCRQMSSRSQGDCRDGTSGPHLSVRIVARPLNLPGEDFGVAFVDGEGVGQQADVFYSRIKSFQAASSADTAQILGHVMAHELGHLLLGMNSHSMQGIMQSHWGERQLRLASMGNLQFDQHQSETIRDRVRGFYETQRAGMSGFSPAVTKAFWARMEPSRPSLP